VEFDGLADVDAEGEVVADDAGEETADEQSVHCPRCQSTLPCLGLVLRPGVEQVELLANLHCVLEGFRMLAAYMTIGQSSKQKHQLISSINPMLAVQRNTIKPVSNSVVPGRMTGPCGPESWPTGIDCCQSWSGP
jgi:hypothetical protein